MARRPQETTRHIREATSVIVNNRKIRCCVSAASPIQDFDLSNKNSNIFVLKVRKLDGEVIDIGREFHILKLLKIYAIRKRSIAGSHSRAIVVHLTTC